MDQHVQYSEVVQYEIPSKAMMNVTQPMPQLSDVLLIFSRTNPQLFLLRLSSLTLIPSCAAHF